MLDISLLPRINALKEKFEQHKSALQGFYSKSVIEKACYEYAQAAIRKDPKVMVTSPQALAFYSELANPSRLRAIIFEQEKQRLSKEMPEHSERLQKFRLSRLKNGYTPGILTDYLHRNGLIAQQKLPETSQCKPKPIPQTSTQNKTVRFA